MEVHSKAIELFLRRVRIMAREILHNEVGLTLQRTRFEWRGRLYPLHIVVFEDDKKLGDYDPSQWRLGLSIKLMRQAKDAVIRDVLRHEIAHLVAHLEYGLDIKPHGQEFKNVCKRFNWDSDISSASLELAQANDSYQGDLSGEKLLLRLQKLMALAESSNPHEAELATSKANQLLIKHNLQRLEMASEDETIYVLPVMFAPRSNSKMHAVYEILKTFFVAPVFTKRNGKVALDIVGDKTSVKIAEYVSLFLQHELERLWLEAKKTKKLSGARAKNSFFAGVARGYVSKITEGQKEFSGTALVKVQSSASLMLSKVYGRLSSTSTSGKSDHHAMSAGNSAGQKLSIRTGIERKGPAGYLLGYDT